ncbi:MAG: MBL fold metallo-hydrolase [Geminicoccaceae bacterium]|nr:MBL fold metallo-hydrolase [Geminicoccaceae bacterium]MCB9942176.1 MBL fold metallo-hydrolase [Geminicoccaceae bacterium]
MRVTVLGCGTSSGVPQIGCDCAVCRSPDPRNRRRRCSIFLEAAGEQVLFDTGPDLRDQCLTAGIARITALIYTHAHADHIHGLDDLRQINNVIGQPIPTHAAPEVMQRIRDRFPYAFLGGRHAEGGFWRPELDERPFTGPFSIGALDFVPFRQKHGRGESWGFRVGPFGYSTDADGLDENALSILEGVEVWIVDALRDKPHPSHAHLERTLGWIDRVGPRRCWLTHMNHEVDYNAWLDKLPPGIEPAHDGLVIDIGNAAD